MAGDGHLYTSLHIQIMLMQWQNYCWPALASTHPSSLLLLLVLVLVFVLVLVLVFVLVLGESSR